MYQVWKALNSLDDNANGPWSAKMGDDGNFQLTNTLVILKTRLPLWVAGWHSA